MQIDGWKDLGVEWWFGDCEKGEECGVVGRIVSLISL